MALGDPGCQVDGGGGLFFGGARPQPRGASTGRDAGETRERRGRAAGEHAYHCGVRTQQAGEGTRGRGAGGGGGVGGRHAAAVGTVFDLNLIPIPVPDWPKGIMVPCAATSPYAHVRTRCQVHKSTQKCPHFVILCEDCPEVHKSTALDLS